jgi:pullulanase
VAINESWEENFGEGGVPDGPNIPFAVASDGDAVTFTYNSTTHMFTISAEPVTAPPDNPHSITIVGNFQSELGCPGDWQPACENTMLIYDPVDNVWTATFDLPAGNWEYKAALNESWDENYGANATRNGPNIPLSLAQETRVKFYYDHKTHWITENVNSIIATAPGSYQSEIGCPGDWQPDCLRSWLQDPDGDGIYSFTTTALPAGNYEVKVAIDESWNENYGADGARNGPNIPFTVPSDGATITFTYDPTTNTLTVNSAAPTGNTTRQAAHWVARDTIAWNVEAREANIYRLHYAPAGGIRLENGNIVGGKSIELTLDPAGLSNEVRTKFPHLSDFTALNISQADLSKVPEILKGQIAISAVNIEGELVDATGIQIPGVLDDLYTYNGQLGITFEYGIPTLRVWAPTAKSVTLHLFDNSRTPVSRTFPMTWNADTGVWSVTGDVSWDNKFYLYEVEVFVHSTGQTERSMVTDPYSVSLAMNSTRSQIVDLNDPRLKPDGWDELEKPELPAPEDITIYELHVRDFSVNDPSVPQEYKGTFKAFTLDDSHGMRHLKALANAGLTHLHLLPVFDIATINENMAERVEPDWNELASYPPDSEQQQAIIGEIRDQDAYNWGYDPYHYTTPEGSYSTDADGVTRIIEFREMVQSLNQSGLRVVMDVVYNHTHAAGQAQKSVLDRVVPGYYHRLNPVTGTVETSTCCPNTATEHNMMEKLMIDSLVTWATAYKVDSFRFDLMGHHMLRNMVKVRETLDSLAEAEHGINGEEIYIYGEGWNFGEVVDNQRGVNATQINTAGTGIGTFNDRLRDGVRGGGSFDSGQALVKNQGFINGLYYDSNWFNQGSPEERARLLHYADWIRVGLTGNLRDYTFVDRNGNTVKGSQIDYNGLPAGYTLAPQEAITYVSKHDNQTLYDNNVYKAPVTSSMAERVRMQNMGMSITSLAQGVPFFHAGVDMLRSKSLDRNSYNSGDWFNKLDFTYQDNNWGVGLPPAWSNRENWPIMRPLLANPDLNPEQADILSSVAHLREMLQIRKSSPLFRLTTAEAIQERLTFLNTGPNQTPGLIVMRLSDLVGEQIDATFAQIVVVFNATNEAQEFRDTSFRGTGFELHPVQAVSADPVVKTSTFNAGTAIFNVPARTTAVFVAYDQPPSPPKPQPKPKQVHPSIVPNRSR